VSHHRRRRKLDLEWCPRAAERFGIDPPPGRRNCGLGTCRWETHAPSYSGDTGATETTAMVQEYAQLPETRGSQQNYRCLPGLGPAPGHRRGDSHNDSILSDPRSPYAIPDI